MTDKFRWILLAAGGLIGSLIFFGLRTGSAAESLETLWELSQPGYRVPLEALFDGLAMLQVAGLALTLACGLLLLHSLGGGQGWARRVVGQPALLATALLLVMAVYGIFLNSIVFQGERYFFLADDAMISMRYARHFAAGEGLVWNIGERVEGYTNFLWTLVMALVHLPGIPEAYTSLVMALLTWGLAVGAVWLLAAALRRLEVSLLWQYVILCLFALDKNILYWSYTGLETLLLVFLAALCAWALLSGRGRVFAVGLALLPLARPDMAVLALVLGLAYLWQNRAAPRRAVIVLALTTLPTLAHTLFRLSYYGDLFPNTYYQKVSPQFDGLWHLGLVYVLRLVDGYLPLLGLLLLSVFFVRDGRLRWLALAFAVLTLTTIRTGGDAFQDLRFLTPALPFVYLCAGALLEQVSRWVERREYRGLLAALLIITAPIPVVDGRAIDLDRLVPDGWWTRTGLLIERTLPPDTLISVTAAGATPYFAEAFTFVDALGLNDAYIARLEPPGNGRWLGHNKYDYAYVYNERVPDVVVTTLQCDFVIDGLADSLATRARRLRTETLIPWAYAEIYEPAFIASYLPNPITVLNAEGRVFEAGQCLFARSGGDLPLAWYTTAEPPPQIGIEFDYPTISGTGWSESFTNRGGVTHRILNGESASLVVPLLPGRSYQIGFRAAAPVEVLDGLRLSLNGVEIDLTRRPDGSERIAVFEGRIAAELIEAEQTTLNFAAAPNPDGVTFDWVRLARE